MSDYTPEELQQDLKNLPDTKFGKYLFELLDSKMEGALTSACDKETEHPDRYLAHYTAAKEIKEALTVG